jgi:hypothetical protein
VLSQINLRVTSILQDWGKVSYFLLDLLLDRFDLSTDPKSLMRPIFCKVKFKVGLDGQIINRLVDEKTCGLLQLEVATA